jgi:eukaryotic-like serine/threonine-protein kinase
MAVTPAHWKRLSPLLDAALDLDLREREAWLAALPPEQADLREELLELLSGRAAVETDDFLNRLPEFSAAPRALTLAAGDTVGPYRLLRELGAGGTAQVWLAERGDGTIQRKVALKLPHLGLVDRGIAERISRERDILAGLEHPNIARLYDAGVDERGRPYMALEYVDGVPPDDYCSAGGLDLRDKLALFLKILRAVAFAHARLIVHRDLKPSNILIATGAEVRLLDFGIARLLHPEIPSSKATVIGAAALTPAYAAPEQFTGQPITVATDVYSLGVILFELLTDSSPYSPDGRSLGAYEHEVLHVEPPLLSRCARPAEAASLRGDLDAIVAKALEKKPEDRYASVEAFANDIERHLAALPIAARPRSFAYVARKFARRNAFPLAAGALVVVALGAALGVAAWQWRHAEQQRRIAVERLANSQAAALFTSTVLMEGMQPGESLSFEQLIERSEQIARDVGANDARTRIFATDFLADWYRANGLYRKAEALLSGTVDSLPAEFHALGAAMRCERAELWGQTGRAKEALASLTREIENNRDDDFTSAQCLLARAYFAANTGDARGALEFANQSLVRFEAAGVEDMYMRVEILLAIGAARGLDADYRGAHENYRESLQLLTAAGRARGRAAANLHDEWSSLWMNAGNPRLALEEIDRGYEILREIAPGAPLDDDRRKYRRSRILAQLGRYAEAMAGFESARAVAVGRNNIVTLAGVQIGEAEVEIMRGDFAAASRQLDDAEVSLRKAKLLDGHVLVTRQLMTRAALLAAQRRSAQARELFTRAIAAYEAQGCCSAHISLALAQRGELEVQDGELESAGGNLERSRSLAPKVAAGSYSRFTARAWYATGTLYEAQSRTRDARDAFATAAAQFAGAVGEGHPDTLRARDALLRTSNHLATQKGE